MTEIIRGSKFVNISLDSIVANKNQPRKEFDQELIDELASSIEENGLIQPIVVRNSSRGYEIIVGERRYRAFKSLAREEIPALVLDVDSITSSRLALVENIQRKDLSPIEEALAYRSILDQYNMTQEELAKELGKSRAYIANTVRYLNLEEDVILFLNGGVISPGHAKALLALKGSRQIEALNIVVDRNLNVRETEELVKSMKTKKEKTIDPYIKELEEKMMSSLGTKVKLKPGRKKSLIEIEYYTDEDLERILEIID